MSKTSRDLFEDYAETLYWKINKNKEGDYFYKHVEDAWQLWQVATANKAEVDLSDDQIYDFWLYRDCMPAIQAGDMKAQFVSAVRALLATSPATPPATTGEASTTPTVSTTSPEPRERTLEEIMADAGQRRAVMNAAFDIMKREKK